MNQASLQMATDLGFAIMERDRLRRAVDELMAAIQEALDRADKNPNRDKRGKVKRTPECQASYDRCVAALAAAKEARKP